MTRVHESIAADWPIMLYRKKSFTLSGGKAVTDQSPAADVLSLRLYPPCVGGIGYAPLNGCILQESMVLREET